MYNPSLHSHSKVERASSFDFIGGDTVLKTIPGYNIEEIDKRRIKWRNNSCSRPIAT